jgi:DNA-binding transcriptional LysR family regulator
MSETAADLDLRLVRYFTVVAQHLNFGRAAVELRLAQPSLSRQVQRLERQLGVRLLDRTPQGSRLTEAGQAFLPQAHVLLRAARQATLTAHAAAPRGSITIGYVGDFVITPATRDLRRRHPGAEVRIRRQGWKNVPSALLERRVDALIVRLPFPFAADKLRTTVLYEEPRVLVVPASHRLAGRESVVLADFADEALIQYPCTAVEWNSFWRLDPRPDGSPAPDGPLVESFDDRLELVAEGRAMAILPAGDRRSTQRDDLASMPIKDVDPCQVVVATRADDHSALVADFHLSARAHLTAEL